MSASNPPSPQQLRAQIDQAKARIAGLQAKLRSQGELLDSISTQQRQYQLLEDICASLERLDELGAADLFWAEQSADQNPAQRIRQIRASVADFRQKVSSLEQSRASLQATIQEQLKDVSRLSEQLDRHAGGRKARREYVVEREAHLFPGRPVEMPWSRLGGEERRYRKILSAALLVAVVLSGLASFWKLPPRDRNKEVVVPERLARLVKEKQIKQLEAKPPEKKEEKPVEKEEPVSPEITEAQQARARAETKGVLAHKSELADLMKDSSPVILGAGTRVTNSGKMTAGEAPRRSIIVAQGSGGISGAGPGRTGSRSSSQGASPPVVQIARIESAIGIDQKSADRLMNKGVGPTRSDEEIQIVFDRYKSSLYRIYNRELRNDPTLRGKIVLRITIEPDGRVSECSIKSSDLASSLLSQEIVERVQKFNFGSKPDVPAITILYPIDFLPAS